MDKKDREEIRSQIEKEIVKTEGMIEEYKEATRPIAPENAIGRISRMDAINNKSVLEAALRKSEEKLKSLKYLITKVDDQEFGKCIRCANDIPLPRLLFLPQSPYCVNCAS